MEWRVPEQPEQVRARAVTWSRKATSAAAQTEKSGRLAEDMADACVSTVRGTNRGWPISRDSS
jgi:hypothetical protein